LVVKVADFPIPGGNFTDITPILERDPLAFRMLIQQMATPHRRARPEIVVCIESFGYLFGAPIAYELGSRIVLARRGGKLPRPTLRRTYAMGYDRHREMEIHVGAISPGSQVLIVDDILAVGGTALAALELVEQAQGNVCGVSVAVELERLQARARLEQRGVTVYSAVRL
jgi:adenine phosphoribosyltransferase